MLAAPSLAALVRAWDGRPFRSSYSVTHSLAGVGLRVEADDGALLERLASTLGTPDSAAPAMLTARVRTFEADGWGHVRLSSARSWDAADLLLGLDSPAFPFERVTADPDWLCLGFRGEIEPLFAFHGADCVFRLDDGPRWRTAVALFLLHRLLRLRPDALFFHAASVAVHGQGALLIGPKGSGKSTTALALCARGHSLLGDETACYLRQTRVILPMRRPVGIKPGPRSRRVTTALQRVFPSDDGVIRLDVSALFPQAPPPAPAALHSILFLRGFERVPRLEAIEAGREELSALQPLACSLVEAPPARRVFEMVQLFDGLRVFHLYPGDPDETAAVLEPALIRA